MNELVRFTTQDVSKAIPVTDSLIVAEKYQVLNGELDKISYAFMFKKGDWVVENWNEAIYELKSPDYNDKDEFTPMVEKYFGYNASSFDYVPSKTK